VVDGPHIDLNADVGEGFGAWAMGADADLLALVTSVNVACGFHAGDPAVMDRTVAAAARAGVALGAHPGYPDLRGFGRRAMAVPPEEVETDVVYQVGALMSFARSHGARVAHVKPHGALYNQAARDERLARAVARGTARAGPDLVLVGLASSAVMRRAAEAEGLRFAAEAFADRAYEEDGSLRPRTMPDAVITDPRAAALQAVAIARDGEVRSATGAIVGVKADTLCLHGDNPSALANARAVRAALQAAGISLRPLAP
jgi:5-oxoprolinase (ATP-hydrolysing) subunit A